MTRKLSVAMLLAALALPASAQALPPLSKGVIVSNANSYELAGTFSKTGAGRELFSPGIVTGDVATGDFNDDGTDDLAFGSFGDAAPRAIVLDGRTRANLLTLTPQKSDAGGVRVGVGDLNGDGRADLATAPAAVRAPCACTTAPRARSCARSIPTARVSTAACPSRWATSTATAATTSSPAH